MSRRRSRERGAVTIWVVLTLVVLIGFVALTTDYGLLVLNRRSLQNATDAAALAGARDLLSFAGDTAAAEKANDTALNVAAANGLGQGLDDVAVTIDNSGGTSSSGKPFTIEVTARRTVATPFAKVMDPRFTTGNVRSRSLVQVIPVEELARLRPWGINYAFFNGEAGHSQIAFNERVDLLFTTSGLEDPTSSGMILPFLVPLAFQGREGPPYDNYRLWSAQGYDRSLTIGRTIKDQPGDLQSVTDRAIRTDPDTSILGRAAQMGDDGSGWKDPSSNSPRLVFLPVIVGPYGDGTQLRFFTYGFAAFWIEDYTYPRLTGRFVRYAVPAEGRFPYSGRIDRETYRYGVYSYRLVE